MATYKDKEEMLDALYDVLADDDEPDEEFDSWFKDKVESFFDFLDENPPNSPRRRARNNSSGNNSARRKRRTANSGAGSGYGSKSWFGN